MPGSGSPPGGRSRWQIPGHANTGERRLFIILLGAVYRRLDAGGAAHENRHIVPGAAANGVLDAQCPLLARNAGIGLNNRFCPKAVLSHGGGRSPFAKLILVRLAGS